MDSINKKQLKRLIRRYEYLLEDWEEVDEINKTANMEMSAELHKHRPPEISASDFESEWEDDDGQESSEKDEVLKKLFRKIVVKCHPDKIPGDLSEVRTLELIDLYEKAIEAHDSQNWALMVIVAIKLEIDLPEEAEEKISEIEEEIIEIENKISSATGSVAWQWYHSEEDVREKLIDNYLALLQKNKKVKKVPTKNVSKLILGLGHPRTGTGYTAKLLQSWGLDVGHEKMGKDGTVDWSLAVGEKSLWQDVDYRDWDWQHIIYCVRDPRESIPSIVYTENIIKGSINFRKEFDSRIDYPNPICSAITSILAWDKAISNMNPFVYRIEDESQKLFQYLQDNEVNLMWDDSMIGKKYNQRDHDSFENLLNESGYIAKRFKIQINEYCEKYGYAKLF